MNKDNSQKVIELADNFSDATITIVGDTNLLMNKPSDEKLSDREKEMEGKFKEKIKEFNFDDDVISKIHRDYNNDICFPSSGLSRAMSEVVAMKSVKGLTKKHISAIIFKEPMLKLNYKDMVINTNPAFNRLAGMIINKRPEFVNWITEFEIKYDNSLVTIEQIINVLQKAGFLIGLGSWRRYVKGGTGGGSYGMFHVDKVTQ